MADTTENVIDRADMRAHATIADDAEAGPGLGFWGTAWLALIGIVMLIAGLALHLRWHDVIKADAKISKMLVPESILVRDFTPHVETLAFSSFDTGDFLLGEWTGSLGVDSSDIKRTWIYREWIGQAGPGGNRIAKIFWDGIRLDAQSCSVSGFIGGRQTEIARRQTNGRDRWWSKIIGDQIISGRNDSDISAQLSLLGISAGLQQAKCEDCVRGDERQNKYLYDVLWLLPPFILYGLGFLCGMYGLGHRTTGGAACLSACPFLFAIGMIFLLGAIDHKLPFRISENVSAALGIDASAPRYRRLENIAFDRGHSTFPRRLSQAPPDQKMVD